jgi:hypothetical protein
MKQSNALRTLEIILDEAVTKGEPSQSAGSILLKAMKLDAQPQSLVDFYELLNKAETGFFKRSCYPTSISVQYQRQI